MFAAAFPPGPAWGSDILVHWYSADGLSDWAPVQEIVNFHQTGGLWYDPVSPMPFLNNATGTNQLFKFLLVLQASRYGDRAFGCEVELID